MIRMFSTAVCFLIMAALHAQPYLDIASFSYLNSPGTGLWRRNNTANNFQYYNTGLNLPLILKKDSSIILFSPYAERWDIRINNIDDLPSHLWSLVLPVSIVKPLSKKWTVTLSAIPRWNGDKTAIFKNSFQMGGAILASYKKQDQLTWKFGIYYNAELSGAFFMPLLGIDWRINNRNNLFGVLPGNLVFEHMITNRIYWGASFKAITNTYTAGFVYAGTNAKYLRIDDNQLSLFADFYLLKNIVLNLEAGHAVLRKLRLGVKNDNVKYYYKENMNDDLLLKASLNYRIRF
jgi:Domain of unknown function (DUF6268)